MKIISGGQTGADQGGLAAGQALGLQTGGWAPKGWLTEDGPAPWLADYGLSECGDAGYPVRTYYNVHDADLTVIFGDVGERGSALTKRACIQQHRPYLVNPTADELREFIRAKGIEVVNVAGNRESKHPGTYELAFGTLLEALG